MGENDIYPYAFEPRPDITPGEIAAVLRTVDFRVTREIYAMMGESVQRHFVEKGEGE